MGKLVTLIVSSGDRLGEKKTLMVFNDGYGVLLYNAWKEVPVVYMLDGWFVCYADTHSQQTMLGIHAMSRIQSILQKERTPTLINEKIALSSRAGVYVAPTRFTLFLQFPTNMDTIWTEL